MPKAIAKLNFMWSYMIKEPIFSDFKLIFTNLLQYRFKGSFTDFIPYLENLKQEVINQGYDFINSEILFILHDVRDPETIDIELLLKVKDEDLQDHVEYISYFVLDYGFYEQIKPNLMVNSNLKLDKIVTYCEDNNITITYPPVFILKVTPIGKIDLKLWVCAIDNKVLEEANKSRKTIEEQIIKKG